MALISVIMPCHNAADHLLTAIDSVLGQSHDALELIVIDDGSTDASPRLLAKITDPRLRCLHQANQGVSSARNRGLAEARGDYVAFLDADDWWAPDCLQRLHAALENRPEAVLAYCGWQNVGLAGGAGEPYLPPDYEAADKAALFLESCPWPIHACLTRHEALKQAGGFDTRLSTSEDYQLWLRIALDRPVVRVPAVLAFYRHHSPQQATGNRLRLALDHWQVQQALLAERPALSAGLGRRRLRELTLGRLLKQAYRAYWDGDLATARPLFRRVMRHGYGRPRDWKYMLPSLLPLPLHQRLLAGRRSPEATP
ncbi:glycosyltransferase [Thiohalobacter sp. IOR34]|uniref:glycosyltransferase n=1 Tax=Thiohalobacter sp. IOR34 TaxID=3057176 RepID=UPI0025B09356|nr:glycosyltransferase [Thiohalobacter sp. IOR34]WJW74443.1 glycosyltransferase [Thiohalobacter sp. IOR34]